MLLISQVEVAVKSYWSNIGKHLPKPEIADMGAVFGGVEVIHSRAYSEILTKLGLEKSSPLLENEPVLNRVTYLNKYVDRVFEDDKKQFLYSLILFTLFTENVSLFSQFYTVLGFNRFKAVLKDTANVVQYTSRKRTCMLVAWPSSIRSEQSTPNSLTLSWRLRSGRRPRWPSTQRAI